jgi:hypothetical protein
MAIKYVKDFEHPADFGYSGSAGKVMVKGYARGGPVRAPKAPPAQPAPMLTAPKVPSQPPMPKVPMGKPPRGMK